MFEVGGIPVCQWDRSPLDPAVDAHLSRPFQYLNTVLPNSFCFLVGTETVGLCVGRLALMTLVLRSRTNVFVSVGCQILSDTVGLRDL